MLWDRYLRQTLNPPSLPDFQAQKQQARGGSGWCWAELCCQCLTGHYLLLQYQVLLLCTEGTAGLAADLIDANIGGMANPGA